MNKGVIDIGNTRCKLAVFNQQGQIIAQKTFKTLSPGLDWLIKQKVSSIIASSVSLKVPKSHKGIPILKVSSDLKLNFINHYQSKTLGADRLCGIAAAVETYPKCPILIIDIGTCVTIDFVNAQGEYLGGNISPGLLMRLKAMHSMTKKLPLVKLKTAQLSLGQNTPSAIANGALLGLQHELLGYIEQYATQYKALKIVVCGGDATHFVFPAKYKIFVHEYFVLQGLYALLKLNENL